MHAVIVKMVVDATIHCNLQLHGTLASRWARTAPFPQHSTLQLTIPDSLGPGLGQGCSRRHVQASPSLFLLHCIMRRAPLPRFQRLSTQRAPRNGAGLHAKQSRRESCFFSEVPRGIMYLHRLYGTLRWPALLLGLLTACLVHTSG